MSSALADTIARAVPLFRRRWRSDALGWAGIVEAQAALLVACMRAVYRDSRRALPGLMREMTVVRAIFVAAMLPVTDGGPAAPDPERLPPIITAVDAAVGTVRFVTTVVAAGEAICAPDADETAHILYLVRSGRVRLYEVLPDGRTITLSILGPGDVFGALTILGTASAGSEAEEPHRVSAEAMTETGLTLMHEHDLPALMTYAPAVATQIIASFAAQLRDLQVLIEQVLARDTSVRLITIILKLAAAFGVPGANGMTVIDFPITHQELANMTGSNRVTVTRKLLELQKDHVIVPERRNTIAVDVPGLRALARRL